MATWRSPRESSDRDMSPTSLLTPLSPSALPQWLRPGRSRVAVLSKGRVKTSLAVLGCILLGWFFTSMLGPKHNHLIVADTPYDPASAGVLSDPSGYGTQSPGKERRPCIIGDTLPDDGDDEADSEVNGGKKPSMKGALADLHRAMSDKLHSWNPYSVKANPSSAAVPNETFTAKGKKRPASAIASAPAGERITDGWTEEDRLGARTRIGKCTILFNGNQYWERAIRTHEAHDRQHGYRLHVLREHIMDDVWSKPAYILSLLLRELTKPESERLDWLMWFDADTVMLNPYIPIDTFLPPPGAEFADVHLLYSVDGNGLNNGVFPVRVNQWAVELFSAITSYRHYRPEDELPFRDQTAMANLMNEPRFAKNIVNAPQRWFNAYQGEHNETLAPFQIRRGDFLVHFAGVPDRETRMDFWLKRAEQHLDDWEVPLKSTSYPQETKDFWAEQKDLRESRKNSISEARLEAQTLLTKVDEQVNEYGERLADDQRVLISDQRVELREILENEKYAEDMEKTEKATQRLKEVCLPLTEAISSSQKQLLQSAHEAILAGEKDLLEGGFRKGISNPEMDAISEAVQNMKSIVMRPQEQWDKQSVSNAVNALTNARAKLQEKIVTIAQTA